MLHKLILGALWALSLSYAAWIIPHAYGELTEDYTIQGLRRIYRSPYTISEGIVFDPKPQPLHEALRARLRPSAPPAPPPAADTPEAWAAYLRALHIDHRLDQGPGVGRQPRLIFTEAGPRLLIGFFDSPVVFSPEHGAVLTFPTLLEGRPALVLDAQEAPW